jgi:hypothetical protein
MWICFNDGFVSVVNDKLGIDDLVVRSRRREILETLFPNKSITELYVSDYKYRIYCSKKEMQKVLIQRIENIDYSNFKSSVVDEDLHNLYNSMWFLHYRYQE